MKMLSEFELEKAQVKKTPMQTGLILEKTADGEMEDKVLYQQIVGSLLYIGGHTRVDISYAVNQLGTMMNCPELNHLRQAKNVIRYLKGTKNYGLLFPRGKRTIVLEGEVDRMIGRIENHGLYCDYQWDTCNVGNKETENGDFVFDGS